VNAGLLSVERQGRGRDGRLAGPPVAEALEALARISPPEPIRSLRQGSRAHALRRARTCYNHLAGRLGVALMSAMLDQGLLVGGDGYHRPEPADASRLSAPGSDLAYRLTPRERETLAAFGLDLADGAHALIHADGDRSEVSGYKGKAAEESRAVLESFVTQGN